MLESISPDWIDFQSFQIHAPSNQAHLGKWKKLNKEGAWKPRRLSNKNHKKKWNSINFPLFMIATPPPPHSIKNEWKPGWFKKIKANHA